MIIFEDEHLLVVNKPAGLNTHSPAPTAGEGVYEWLKNREPRWSNLAILHRLDKETSGLIIFGKSELANRSLSAQFAERRISKKYLLLTDRRVSFKTLTVKSALVRAGDRYRHRPVHSGADIAETRFTVLSEVEFPHAKLIEAEPVTGKTHQIRAHAAAEGFPILGDKLYEGTAAERVFLHAAELTLEHPATQSPITFSAPHSFSEDARTLLRTMMIDPHQTDAYRLRHGAADGMPGWYIERLGDYLLSQQESALRADQVNQLQEMLKTLSLQGAYHKILNRKVWHTSSDEASPRLVCGEGAHDEWSVRENGIEYRMSFNEGYSVGLFLDQRDNRRRVLNNYISPGFFLREDSENFSVLNTFAYTCGFSVCAAKAGATVTSLDLSRKYLEWGKRNFLANQIDPSQHDFIYGDTFDWLKRFRKKNRLFDFIIFDPPTFSQSKEQGTFRAEKDYEKLVSAGLPILKRNGVLLASTNAAQLHPEKFLDAINAAVASAKRKIIQQHYVPQPIDFPITREEPGYLKTVWLRIA